MRTLYAIIKTDIDGHAELKGMAATEKGAKMVQGQYRSGEVESYDIYVLQLPTLEECKAGMVGSVAEATREPEQPCVDSGGSAEMEADDVPVIESPDPVEQEADHAAAKPKPRRKAK